jgi:RNA polymerase sigma-70 factor (ECF subfamily)
MQDLINHTDNDLAEIIKKGKKKEADEAFKVLYKRYSGRLHAYCLKIINDREAAEDIFQETFVRFYKKVQKDYRSGNVQGFIFTIARNLCLNYKRNLKDTVEFEDFHLKIEENKFEDLNEKNKLLKYAIDLLDFEYKEPLVLRIYDGLNYKEISEICEISEENARKRVFRAKNKLKQILEPYYNELYG